MRGRLLNLPAVARALGFVFIAIAIVAAALHFRTPSPRVDTRPAENSTAPDPLADELQRCQFIADQANDDPACEAAWAENRRRFFTYAPASAPAPTTSAKGTGR
jgi:conjugative transfer region protein TrbK